MANLGESSCSVSNQGSESGMSSSQMGATSDSEHVSPAASASGIAPSTSSSTMFLSARSQSVSSEREAEIERSKVHWSDLVDFEHGEDEVAEESNLRVFKAVQRHPAWGDFFRTFGDGGIYDSGELEVGELFAMGAQGEIYHVRLKSSDPKYQLWAEEHGTMHVLKVYKRGTFMLDLLKAWPNGLFRHFEEVKKRTLEGKSHPAKFACDITCATILQDGRFGFLMIRETEDVRALIDRFMTARTTLDCGPFPIETAALIMYRVAKGMDWLHSLDIVHRDLKASNVLCTWFGDGVNINAYLFNVADFECSSGVYGTGFFRAPEILQAFKGRVVNSTPNLFTKSGDVYSFGMLCYEILTGRLPFEGHPINDYDLVLNGQRPEVPDYVAEWARDLLRWCWESDPAARPTSGQILITLEDNSVYCKDFRASLDEYHYRIQVSTDVELREYYTMSKPQFRS